MSNPAEITTQLRRLWSDRSPAQKRMLTIGGVVGGLMLITYAGVSMTDSGAPVKRQIRQPTYDLLTGRSDTSKLGLDNLQSQLTALSRRDGERDQQVKTLQAQLEQQRTRAQELESRAAAKVDLPPPLPDRSGGRLGPPLPPPPGAGLPGGPLPLPLNGGQEPGLTTAAPRGASEIEVVRPDSAGSAQAAQREYAKVTGAGAGTRNAEHVVLLPAGTILSGVLLTGLDAATANNAKSQPVPALLRLKGVAILPNRYTMDLADCNLIAGSAGDLSSERAYLRAESISCVKADGTILESALSGYATGEDGKAGVRGRLVSKTGSMIAKSLMAGFASGLAQTMQPAKVPQLSLNPGASAATQRPDLGTVGQEALYSGVSGATTQVASYYLDMARNVFPVLEVDAGRKIDFIITSPVRLRASPVTTGQVAGSTLQAAANGASSAAGQVIAAVTAPPVDSRQAAVASAQSFLPR